MGHELRLSPAALQTGLLRRWRAELAHSFVGDVISLSMYVATRKPGGFRDKTDSRFVNAEPMGDDLDGIARGVQARDLLALPCR